MQVIPPDRGMTFTKNFSLLFKEQNLSDSDKWRAKK
jgi:hypothetical protein